MKVSIILLLASLTIIFTGATIIFIYWGNEFQWFILVLVSSSSYALIGRPPQFKNRIMLLFFAWLLSMILSSFTLSYPLILWESNFIANEVIVSIVGRVILVSLIGILLSLVSLLFFSLISG